MKSLAQARSRISITFTWLLLTMPVLVSGQVYDGAGAIAGATAATAVTGNTNIRTTVVNILKAVISYVALAAVVVIVIAAIMLVVGFGSEDSKEKLKKVIIYTIAGMIVILIASGIVLAITTAVTN